ncbi:MAG: class I SAM-dependent methyltransferase [Acidobacteriota bacterium]|nr:class I SAM-dependent methyltransferase [Acidobacteriota bacterium]
MENYLQMRRMLWNLRGNAVQCPACEWHGSHFLEDLWHEGTICPKCQSDTRHRLLLASFQYLPEFSTNSFLAGKNILHVAPELQISHNLNKITRKYVTADLQRSDVDIKIDITRMPSIASESFDIVIACDVLEHVYEDSAVLAEFYRVLRKDGTAILTVPQSDHAATTYEDKSITSPQEREKAFGQWDHLRIYGADFVDRVRAAGFKPHVVDEDSFDESVVERLVLRPPQLSSHPLATNYRRVFFCRK